MAGERTVLVTGAGGFIGGRMVEVLQQDSRFAVRAAVRRWSTAARIGRLPLDPVQLDLLDPAWLRGGLAGVDAVVHCAVGDRRATVEGTRNLLAAAREVGVRRVVHLSTVDVYGRAEGTVTEAHPWERTNRAYGDAKIEAEETCLDHARLGHEVVILRPTIVYGPFSESWTIEFALRFEQGDWRLPREGCQGSCNLVYVDDVVRAALLALDAPGTSGEAFNVNGPDRVTWQEYFDALNRALGFPPLHSPGSTGAHALAAAVAPVRAAVKATYKALEEPILALYKRSKPARVMMKWAERTLRTVPSPAEFDLYGRAARFPSDKARDRLGYRPAVAMDRGIALSVAWLRHEGVVTGRGA
jgi:nucleoside-diphosphate-sugar epimerase